jgi:cobaltochelatase CobT
MSHNIKDKDRKKSEKFKNAITSTLRALAQTKDVAVVFSANIDAQHNKHLTLDKAKLSIPDQDLSHQSATMIRGEADSQALRLYYHDQDLHLENTPMDLSAQEAFDALERARCESLGANKMKGVELNLNKALENFCLSHGYDHVENRDEVNLADALYILARSELSNAPPPEHAEKIINLWEPWIKSKLGHKGLSELKPALTNQNDYAQISINIISELDYEVGEPQADPTDSSDPPEDDSQTRDEDTQDEDKEQNQQSDQSEQHDENETLDSEMQSGLDELSSDQVEDLSSDNASEIPHRKHPEGYIPGPKDQYRVYTTAYDEIVKAEDLAETEELDRLRGMLDAQLSQLQGVITKLANRLQRKLMAKQQRHWEFDLDEGILDTSRLARIIANPSVPSAYKQEKETEFKDTIVSLLIDNSGSMRGRPIAIAAICTDILARTLERCGVKVEILGFTTRAWKGGKSRDLWIQNGRPPHPGRLNDLRHIIYKSADTPWRRSHKNLGLMLKEGLLKENIDGEALVWAYNRISLRPEQRKILMVISDGAPVDDSTLSINPSNILEQDLRNVIRWIETASKIELTAIGIGHDVTRYYKKAITIADADELAKALAHRLSELFDE